MRGLEWLEAASYIVTIIGLPFAIGVYIYGRRRERQSDEEDYMTEWCQRDDFRSGATLLLQGEDPGFVATIGRIAQAGQVRPLGAR